MTSVSVQSPILGLAPWDPDSFDERARGKMNDGFDAGEQQIAQFVLKLVADQRQRLVQAWSHARNRINQ